MKVVLMAGGKGTRIGSVFSDIPKPLVPVEGKPLLERTVECLKKQGFTELILTVSHMSDRIIRYFGDGSRFGVRIEYYLETEPLGNAGALFMLQDRLTEDFLLINADVLFDVDLERFVRLHRQKGGLVTLFTHPNAHPYDSGLLEANAQGLVTHWWTKEVDRPRWYQNRTNAGLHIINPAVFSLIPIRKQDIGVKNDGTGIQVDLDRQLLIPLVRTGRVFCYDSTEYVKDIGTPERYRTVCSDLRTGTVQSKSLKNRQKAVFLDRDGTVNEYVGFLTEEDQLQLISGAAQAIRQINLSGTLAILVTNQPVIARGQVTLAGLQQIHNKLETLLGQEGAYLDGIYFCPHHPDSGFSSEIPELKTVCNCRKPKPGMLLQAAQEHNIDLANSWMVGDSENDILAGKAAGCRTALIGEGDYGQNLTVPSLAAFSDTFFSTGVPSPWIRESKPKP